jgi:very-short-patch-repair endonuclease
LRWKVRSGRWRQVLPRVYATFTGKLTEQQRLMAAWLYAGPDAQISGITALRMHGVRYLPPDGNQVHILVPHQQRIRSTRFVQVHRTTRPDPRAINNGALRVCGVARAVIDTALTCHSLPTVRAMVAHVVQEDLATIEQLRTELGQARRNGSALARIALGEVADGVRSAAEAALRSTLKRSRLLPPIRWNPALHTTGGRRLPTPDAWIDQVALAIEVDSREFHLSPADWERTLARHNQLSRYGAQVLHFPPSEIRRAPAQVLHTVEETYLQRLKAGAHNDIKIKGR